MKTQLKDPKIQNLYRKFARRKHRDLSRKIANSSRPLLKNSRIDKRNNQRQDREKESHIRYSNGYGVRSPEKGTQRNLKMNAENQKKQSLLHNSRINDLIDAQQTAEKVSKLFSNVSNILDKDTQRNFKVIAEKQKNGTQLRKHQMNKK